VKHILLPLALLALGTSIVLLPSPAAEVYSTDFDSHAVGPDQWAGTDGWLGNSIGVGAHGIDSNQFAGALGNTAYLGGNLPSCTTIITLFRSVNVDPADTGVPVMAFETLVGVDDPGHARRDDFIFNFYNTNGQSLAAIRFSNQEQYYGIWRRDGSNQYDTGVEFFRGELHLLHAEMDLAANTWSADLDGIPLFTNAQFSATGNARTFGSVAAQWDLTANFVNGYGSNWMLVADWSVTTLPQGETPFTVRDFTHDAASNSFSLTWSADAGYDYGVEYSHDLENWTNDLQSSIFSNVTSAGTLSFTDPIAYGASHRYYRVRRTETPW
jgi:hypothetical protein